MPAARSVLHHPSLRARVVVITGGGRGFGWFIAEELLRAGAKVVLTAHRHPEELKEVQGKADAIAPGNCVTLRADVARWDDCQATIAAAMQAFGRIDVLINNAGRGPAEYGMTSEPGASTFYEVPVESFRNIFETNVVGVFQMTKAALPHMLQQKFGKVFSISTGLPTMTLPGYSPYGASKAALESLHRVWALELKDKGVDVNVLLPGGAADTEFLSQRMKPGPIGTRASPGGVLPGDIIVPPAVWLCTDATNGLRGERIIARFWDDKLPPAEALRKCLQPRSELPAIM
jgi:NAD(P)-dependent dehydrogenase (short-subunit alcohol dehydrogenase family)